MELDMAQIEIVQPTDSESLSVSALCIVHSGCSGRMRWRRDQANNYDVLRCPCGWELRLPPGSNAPLHIQYSSIDGQSRILEHGSFACSPDRKIVVSVLLQ